MNRLRIGDREYHRNGAVWFRSSPVALCSCYGSQALDSETSSLLDRIEELQYELQKAEAKK